MISAREAEACRGFLVDIHPSSRHSGPAEPTGGGLQAASVLKQGSVMDIPGGGSFKKSSTPGSQSSNSQTGTGGTELSKAVPVSTLFKQSGWNCDICLLSNKEEVDKCVACQTPKPGGQKPKGTTEAPKTDLFAKFQQPSGSWTCGICLIQNQSDDSKCVACQSQKPGAALPSSLLLTGSIQPGNWICSKCLIQNKQANTVCVACKTPKTSGKPIELNKSDSPFAKLKPAAGTWECEMCLVQNKGISNSCVACQTPKPLKLFKHPPGDWTCDTCLVSNKETAVNCVACNYSRPCPPRTQTAASKTAGTSEAPKSDLFAKFQQPSGSWTCDMCLIQNKPDDSKCVACQSQKPGAALPSSLLLTGSIQPGNWICSKCLIQNKQANTVCVACKTPKTSGKPIELNKSDSPFAKLKPAAGTWECEMCLVQNKGISNSCVACQTPKPLKLFKHPPGDWTCDTCLVSNKETAVNCVACNYSRPCPPRTQTAASKTAGTSEAPKSDLFAKFQQPSGSWTCDMCLIQNKPDNSKCVACQSQKPGTALSSSLPLTGSIQPGNWI